MTLQNTCRVKITTRCSTVFFTAVAFLLSGTEQIIWVDFIICCTDILIAYPGTSSIDLNQPSPNCCFLHGSSNSTINMVASFQNQRVDH